MKIHAHNLSFKTIYKRKIAMYILAFLLVALLSLPLVFSFFKTGYFPTHDGEWAVVRLADMYRTLRDFQFPARYSGYLNYGYGYPLFNFAYPMPYYLGVVFVIAGFGFVNTVKILFVGATILSAYFIFLASRHIWKNTWAGMVSAVLYLYFPYRLVDLYVRGSLGEILAFAAFPLIILSISVLSENSRPIFYVIVLAVSTAFLITSHNIMSVLFLLVIVVFTSIHILFKKKQMIYSVGLGLILGIGLSAFFSLPALFEKHNILLSKIPIADRNLYFVQPHQLLFSSFGYGIPTEQNSFTYQIGIPQFLILLLSVVVVVLSFIRKQITFYAKVAATLVFLNIFFIMMMFSVSSALWRLPLLSEINYPWTMLSQIGFCIALLGGFLVTRIKPIAFIVGFLALVAAILYAPFARPSHFVDRGDNFYVTNDATTTSSTELLPLWVETRPIMKRADQKIETTAEAVVSNLTSTSNLISFSITSNTDNIVHINTIYYPGWKLYLNGKETDIDYMNDKGIISTAIPAGNHSLRASFTETPFRIFANTLTIISGVCCIAIVLFRKKLKILYI